MGTEFTMRQEIALRLAEAMLANPNLKTTSTKPLIPAVIEDALAGADMLLDKTRD